ncbi:molybdopterin oxidoreductase family protein [Vibrio agarivorans]|uniref:Nitrate reductase n=1 Tax=Vibrio agarivorans TaxID=153622 RepID=A0ABT7Y0H0_9VIBR|nr:nitrate reductase [Vibrio agarivorans]
MTQQNDGWIKTTCAYCGVGCGVEARPTISGELEVRGDKSHPSNYGKLCTKGIALGETVIQDGRLLTPTLNTPHGEQSLDWSDATSLVAEKFAQTIKEHGADSVAFYVSGQLLTEDYYVANKLIKGFMGTANIDSNSRLCMASSVVGHKRAFGADTVPVCYEDLEQAELVVLVGSNLAWCHPVLFQRLRMAKQANPQLKVVVIDPRETDSDEISDLHLSIDSGADVALFNGLLNYLHRHNHIDQTFIKKHTQQFEQALESAQQEQCIERQTGLSGEQLAAFYKLFAQTNKVVTVYSQGVNQSTSGADKVNSILNCHLATGKIGKPGCGPFSVTGQPNAMGGREVGALANMLCAHMELDNPEHHQLVSEFWQAPLLANRPGLKAVDMFDGMADGKIKAVWIMATNPAVSLPNSEKVKQALANCPFVVVSDCIKQTETTALADLLLPVQGWSEKSGTVTNSERRVSRQRRVMPSPGDARPDWWVISQVAQKMGFGEAFDYLHEGEIFKEYATLTGLGNMNGERDFSLIGLSQLDDQGYSVLEPQQWPVLKHQTEVVNQRFFTHGQFYTADAKARFVPVSHKPPQSTVNSEFPLLLNSGRTRDHWHTMSRTGLAAQLGDHTPEPYVLVHPDTAAKYGLKDQSIARLHNRFGECLAKVTYSPQQQLAELFVPIHWNGQTANNSKPCNLIAPYTDSLSGQPEFKHTPVVIEPCLYQSQGLFLTRQPIELEGIEYWARQKIADGYAYHIESNRSPKELQICLSSLIKDQSRHMQYQDGNQNMVSRFISDQAQAMSEMIVVKGAFGEGEKAAYIASFNEPVDTTKAQSWFPAAQEIMA